MAHNINSLHILGFILVSNLWVWTSADIFSAITKMEHLLETRQRVINDLDDYIQKEEGRLRDLKQYLNLYKREQEKATEDVSNYLGNPINAYTLIKRLTTDLDYIEERINKTTEFISVRNKTSDANNETILYPTTEDLKGAQVALKRLQRTYKMKVKDLAEGILNGIIYRLPMLASDCYELGVHFFDKKDYVTALAWHEEALDKFKSEDFIAHNFTEIDILEYIGIIYYHLNDPETAADWTMKVLEIDPTHARAIRNILTYEQIIMENNGELETAQLIDGSFKNSTNTSENQEVVSKETGDAENDTDTEGKTTVKDDLADNEPDTKNEPDANNEHDVKNNPEAKNEPDTEIEPDAEKETDAKNETDVENETDAQDDTVARVEIDINIEARSKTDDANDYETNAKNDNNTKDEMDSKDKIQVVDETGNKTDTAKDKFGDESEPRDKNETLTPKRRMSLEESIVEHRKDTIMYEALCRGEYDVAPKMASRLFCRYLRDKPFLKLAPIKMEQRYIDPDVFLFHDVISDREIEHVKEKAKPEFQRALVGGKRNESKPAHYRISQSSWLHDNTSEIVFRLSQRVSDFTGLDMEFAEELQVGNYGIGGQYEPHMDWSGIRKRKPHDNDRIATAMFYMSDVTQGGATVFPKLGLTVFPRKGSAVFWMNLHASGEGNLATKHAACPVLEGSKWVSNKWIAMWGQEFIKPCTTEHQLQDVLRDTPAPVPIPATLL